MGNGLDDEGFGGFLFGDFNHLLNKHRRRWIVQAKKAYKIYAAKIQDETMSDYTMDHSSFIYFMDSDDNLLRIVKADDSLDDMTKIVERYLR